VTTSDKALERLPLRNMAFSQLAVKGLNKKFKLKLKYLIKQQSAYLSRVDRGSRRDEGDSGGVLSVGNHRHVLDWVHLADVGQTTLLAVTMKQPAAKHSIIIIITCNQTRHHIITCNHTRNQHYCMQPNTTFIIDSLL
jgi:hypothetical protein